MDFFLVRHGEAKAEREDARRPLSERGWKDAERVARAAAEKIKIDAILHSDKIRARETAEIFGRVLSIGAVRETAGLAPEDDPLVARAELEAADKPLMLVGHLPHLARLVALLVAGDSEKRVADFSPATIVCIARDGRKWRLNWTMSP